MSRPVDFARLKEDIQKTLFDYVAADTVTDSEHEHKVGAFFEQRIGSLPYFKEHPEYWGLYPIPNDYRGRHVCWSMVKGKGNKTVVLIHHYDVVPVEDFKTLKEYAFKPVELKGKLEEIAETLPEDACKDLKDGGWFFGRGVCDMKGGGSIQYSLLTQYSEDPDFEGNVIVIGVPDEENLSAGMRGAILLLNELKDKYGLEYEFMFNSEPHQRKDFSKAVFSCGSIGKLMPFVYIRGFLAHVGKSFEGINPVGIMGDVVSGLELNMDLADAYAGECAPGPTWLYLKDSKISYDVSMPLNMYGCLSVLTLIQSPQELLGKVKVVCEDAFDKAIARAQRSYEIFLKNTGREPEQLPWKTNVKTFGDLYRQISAQDASFEADYKAFDAGLQEQFLAGKLSIIDYNYKLLDFMMDRRAGSEPTIVYGLVPPYYPAVSNFEYEKQGGIASTLVDTLTKFSVENFGLDYEKEYFYTGISDLSYAQMKDAKDVRAALEDSTPLFGGVYDVPLEAIEAISMPVMNIGPWGKDFHKMTERVLIEDELVRTPAILHKAICEVLK